MRRNRNDFGHNSFGRRPLRGRPIGENKPITYHPQGLKGAQEDFRSRVQLLARSSDNRDLSAALFKSLFTSAINNGNNELLDLLKQIRYEALKLHTKGTGDKVKEKSSGILKRTHYDFSKGVQRRNASPSEYEVLASRCNEIERLYNTIRRIAQSERFRKLRADRNLEDYKRKLSVACSRIFIPRNDDPIIVEHGGRVTVRRSSLGTEIIIDGDGGGGGPSGYDYVVLLIKNVKTALFTTYKDAWEFVKNFIKQCASYKEDENKMQFHDRCLEAHRICQDKVKETMERQQRKVKPDKWRSEKEIYEGVWETCYRYTLRRKNIPEQ